MMSSAYSFAGRMSSVPPVVLSPSMSPTPPITISASPTLGNQGYQTRPTSPCEMNGESMTAFLNSTTESLPPGAYSPNLQTTPLLLTPQKPVSVYSSSMGQGPSLLSPVSFRPAAYAASTQVVVGNHSPMIYTASASPVNANNGSANSSTNVSLISNYDVSGFQQAPPPTPTSAHSRYLAGSQASLVWPESPFLISTPFNSPSGILAVNYPVQSPQVLQLTPDQFFLNVSSWSPQQYQYQPPGAQMMGQRSEVWNGNESSVNGIKHDQAVGQKGFSHFDWHNKGGQCWEREMAPSLGNDPRHQQRCSEQKNRIDGGWHPMPDERPSRAQKNPLLKQVEGENWERANIRLTDLSPVELKELMMDRGGSKYVQRMIDWNGTEWGNFFDVVMGDVEKLSTHVYANHVVQKLALLGTPRQKFLLGMFVVDNFQKLSYQWHACRIVQAVISGGNDAIQANVLMALEHFCNLLDFVRDQNRNHIVQVAIRDTRKKENIQFIVNAIAHESMVREFATHPFGCRVIQQIVENCSQQQKQPVVEILISNLNRLIMDQYGNYVLQRVLEHGSMEDVKGICSGMKPNIFQYCQHKHSSPVVEKCLEVAPPETRNALIAGIVDAKPLILYRGKQAMMSSEARLEYLLKDQFGNYVIQKILDVCEDELRLRILEKMVPAVANLQKFNYGKHISAKLQKYFQNQLRSDQTFRGAE